ncbi:UNVERIFIED_CONTAM: hypothetical protein PYX00_005165 [Menopon gallinae]|uniref:Uncharacterized protein n=1 Tax=Menopon gallinae TaxID=328185 RepID=A0AAW2HQL0_9NEOP
MSEKQPEINIKIKKNRSSRQRSRSTEKHQTVKSQQSPSPRCRHRPKEEISSKQYEKNEKPHCHHHGERRSSESHHTHHSSNPTDSNQSKQDWRKHSIDSHDSKCKHWPKFETISEKSVTADTAYRKETDHRKSGERRDGGAERISILQKIEEVKESCQKMQRTDDTASSRADSIYSQSENRIQQGSTSSDGTSRIYKDTTSALMEEDVFSVPAKSLTQTQGLLREPSFKSYMPVTSTYHVTDFEGERSVFGGISQITGKEHQIKILGSALGELSQEQDASLDRRFGDTPMSRNDQYVAMALFGKHKSTQEKVNPNTEPEDAFGVSIKNTLRGLLLHIMFLTTITTIAIGMTAADTYYLTDLTHKIFYDTSPEKSMAAIHPHDHDHDHDKEGTTDTTPDQPSVAPFKAVEHMSDFESPTDRIYKSDPRDRSQIMKISEDKKFHKILGMGWKKEPKMLKESIPSTKDSTTGKVNTNKSGKNPGGIVTVTAPPDPKPTKLKPLKRVNFKMITAPSAERSEGTATVPTLQEFETGLPVAPASLGSVTRSSSSVIPKNIKQDFSVNMSSPGNITMEKFPSVLENSYRSNTGLLYSGAAPYDIFDSSTQFPSKMANLSASVENISFVTVTSVVPTSVSHKNMDIDSVSSNVSSSGSKKTLAAELDASSSNTSDTGRLMNLLSRVVDAFSKSGVFLLAGSEIPGTVVAKSKANESIPKRLTSSDDNGIEEKVAGVNVSVYSNIPSSSWSLPPSAGIMSPIFGTTTVSGGPSRNLSEALEAEGIWSAVGRNAATSFTSSNTTLYTKTKMHQESSYSLSGLTTVEPFKIPSSTYRSKSFLPLPFLYMADMPSGGQVSELPQYGMLPSGIDRGVVKRNQLNSSVTSKIADTLRGMHKTDSYVNHSDDHLYRLWSDRRKGVNYYQRPGSSNPDSQSFPILSLSGIVQDLRPLMDLYDSREDSSASSVEKRHIVDEAEKNCRCCPRKSLKDSHTVFDFWEFAESTLIQLLYWKFWYSYVFPTHHKPEEDKKYLFENQIMGVPRMRQVRVRNDSCKIHPDVARFFDECYHYYSLYSEETRPIREDMDDSITATAWRYTSYEALESSYYWGTFSTYGGGGYYLDLSLNADETMRMIRELKNKTWITRSTRAVFIDFTIYNVNVNLFCICKIVLEFPPSGGMLPKADFASVKLIRYLSTYDFFILGLEFFFGIFVIFLTVEVTRNILELRKQFLRIVWSYVDIMVLLLSYVFIIYSIARYVIIQTFVTHLPIVMERYVEFSYVRAVQVYYNYLTAVLVFFAWLRLMKFLNLSKTMLDLHGTLRKVESYHTVWASCTSLLQGLIGEFEYKEMEEVNRVMAPIFLVLFVFFMYFILMNMFLAIINDAYASVKSTFDVTQVRKTEYLNNAFMNLIGCCCFGLDKKLDKKRKTKRTYDELRHVLKRSGFTDPEIALFLQKYNIDIHEIVTETENRRIIRDLELKGLDFSQNAYQSDIEELRRRVDRLGERIQEMQRNLQPVVEKIDQILTKLSQ